MLEVKTHLSIERAKPATLEEVFSIALREDFKVTKAYTKPTIVTVARSPGPKTMEIDVVESSDVRREHRSCGATTCDAPQE